MTDAACGENSTLESESANAADYGGSEPTEDSYDPWEDTEDTNDWPDDVLPEREAPPFDRDRFLPQSPIG